MALLKKALNGWLLSKFLTHRRMAWYQRLTPGQRASTQLLLGLTPLGRFSLGGLALFAARRLFTQRRYA
ncbi:hypothetical protein [Archangium sp.]|jgi:hypothetical protein|uniref:hypothetical protein n=1 Tax=Archangium sp. TaxID=1872627 RepID=UPI002ED85A00